MRKIVLVAAMVLASASAQADGSRSLSLSAAGAQTSAPLTTPTITAQVSETAPATEAPKYSDRPPAVPLSAPATAAAPAVTTPAPAPVTTVNAPTRKAARADKPKPNRSWTERRIISELHRHGIYW